ncbi:hypothetical protein F2Q70_00035948 [Brassica cretica]|uniref:Uncharacterized protein n=1 Tax=Brassica cretica TaxID=69181 RepID=A0A8S9JPC0_BRACR|nr:hypothetical protein F2Q70_00035948 [Brassica cretica]
MLGTTSPWVGSEFSCLPRSWLAADSPCSSWFSRSVFIAGCVSGGSPFHHVCHSRFG